MLFNNAKALNKKLSRFCILEKKSVKAFKENNTFSIYAGWRVTKKSTTKKLNLFKDFLKERKSITDMS